MPQPEYSDRGRLNALRSIVAAVSDELRSKEKIVKGIVEFSVSQLPSILRGNTPFELLSSDGNAPSRISPYDFEILDLVSGGDRPAVFETVGRLVQALDIDKLSAPLQNVELIGIDESQIDFPLPQSSMAYLKTVAFRMFKKADGSTDEQVGPLLSKMRVQLNEGVTFENENKLLGYMRNNFVAYVSALTALSFNRKPFVVLHGPLVRTIGGFSNLTFDYETARDLFNIEAADGLELAEGGRRAPIEGDNFMPQNLPIIPNEAVNGDSCLSQFNEFCIKKCQRKCDGLKVFNNDKAIPPANQTADQMMKERYYPGFCLYFWILRSLVDLARVSEATITSVVEDISASTEVVRLTLPSLFAKPDVRQSVEEGLLKEALEAIKVTYPSEPYQRPDLYRAVTKTIESLRISDSNTFSYSLAEGQYTTPVQTYRYCTRKTFRKILSDDWLGTHNDFDDILDVLFPERLADHPGYRMALLHKSGRR